jgi:ubiquinone/menaquinone biosynthesis C-methylase UbiE
MTWEEAIVKIRKEPEFNDLVRLAYFDADLSLNVKRFSQSEEYAETLKIIKRYAPNASTLLDIGSGNGVSAVNFAISKYEVTALEPDTSDTVGYGAICKLKEKHELANLKVYNDFAENLEFPEHSFDVVYVRQAMHHANDLAQFMAECVRVLKPNGLLLTVRDHVIYDKADKELFLREHPLHKFYGGENAYTSSEYRSAIESAGAVIKKELKFYDSSINYFPLDKSHLDEIIKTKNNKLKKQLQKKLGAFAKTPLMLRLYKSFKNIKNEDFLDESKISGRMYSYIALKK